MKEVVVLAREEGGEKRLVGYVVMAGELDVGELRGYLKGTLTGLYGTGMCWLSWSEFPLTPNGKLDRQGLPSPDAPLLG